MKRRQDLILKAMAEKSVDAIVMYNYGDMLAGVFKYATDTSNAYPLAALLCKEGVAISVMVQTLRSMLTYLLRARTTSPSSFPFATGMLRSSPERLFSPTSMARQ